MFLAAYLLYIARKFNNAKQMTLNLSVSNASEHAPTSTKISRHPSITEGAHTRVPINSNLITETVAIFRQLRYTQGSNGAKTVIKITRVTCRIWTSRIKLDSHHHKFCGDPGKFPGASWKF